jgi:regulator of replication initiation timing
MTQTGRVLTYVNLVLALVFTSWAIGLYVNAVPWHTPPASDGVRVQGLVEQLKDQITSATAARNAADNRWADATLEVQALEKQRPELQQLYANRMKAARRGNVAGVDPPVQTLEFAGENLKPTGAPIQFDGAPALTFDGYAKAIQDKIKEITDTEEELKKIVDDTKALTLQIDGFDPPGGTERITAEQKGLRRRLYEIQKQADELRLEQEYLRSPLTNATLDTALLKKRQAALSARLTELKSAVTAVGRK